jgi:hypothetical protein
MAQTRDQPEPDLDAALEWALRHTGREVVLHCFPPPDPSTPNVQVVRITTAWVTDQDPRRPVLSIGVRDRLEREGDFTISATDVVEVEGAHLRVKGRGFRAELFDDLDTLAWAFRERDETAPCDDASDDDSLA